MKFLSPEHSAERSFTVSEHKKLSMLLVCILVDVVVTLFLTFLPVDSISNELWSAFCSLHRIAFTKNFAGFGFGTWGTFIVLLV